MKFILKRDYTLGSEFAYDEDKKQPVIIKYTCEKVIEGSIVTHARVIGKTDGKIYSTNLKNLSNIGVVKWSLKTNVQEKL